MKVAGRRRHGSDAVVAQTVTGLGHRLGLDVIAEGVETEAQRNFLQRHDCDLFQGYPISRPLPLARFESLLSRPMQPAWDPRPEQRGPGDIVGRAGHPGAKRWTSFAQREARHGGPDASWRKGAAHTTRPLGAATRVDRKTNVPARTLAPLPPRAPR